MAKTKARDHEREVVIGFWPKIASYAASIPFAEQLLAAWYCAFDQETPAAVRYTLMGALAYFILPFDALPDMLPLFGFADDASLLSAALLAVGTSVTDAHRQAAREALDRLKNPA